MKVLGIQWRISDISRGCLSLCFPIRPSLCGEHCVLLRRIQDDFPNALEWNQKALAVKEKIKATGNDMIDL